MNLNPDQIVRRVNILIAERAQFQSYWGDIASVFMPRKALTLGTRLDFSRIFDSSPIRALNTMASGFHSWLTNPASKWFQLAMTQRELMEIKVVKVWLEDTEEEIFSTFNNSNLDETLQEFYIDAGGFGTGNVFIQEDFKDRVRFTELPISEVFLEEDARGRVTRIYRKFEYRVQQAWDLWGKAAGAEVRTKILNVNTQNDKVVYVHYIGPREIRQEGKKDNSNMEYQSVWITYVKKELVSVGGFNEFPVACGRFHKKSGEVWGFSPAMDNLADAHMLNAMKKTLIRAAMKIIDPPIVMPDRGFILPLNLNPSGINYRNPQTKADDFTPIITKGNIPIGIEMINDTREAINLGMFVRLFQAFGPERTKMTATEVNARIREGMALLGPVVGRFQQEVLDPIVLRTFNILYRNGFLPPVPEILAGREFTVRYISPLARAQRESEVGAILRMLSTVGEMSAFVPNIIDKINPDKAIDEIADVIGVTPQIIRDDDEVAEIRQARMEAQQAATQAEQITQGAKAARDIGAAEKDLQMAGK